MLFFLPIMFFVLLSATYVIIFKFYFFRDAFPDYLQFTVGIYTPSTPRIPRYELIHVLKCELGRLSYKDTDKALRNIKVFVFDCLRWHCWYIPC